MRWFLCVRNPDSCSCSGLVLAFSGWYFWLLIVSRHRFKIWGGTCRNLSRSVLEMWYVFVDTFCFRCQKQRRYCCNSILVLFWFCWSSNGLLGSGFYMPMFLSFAEFSVPIQGQSRGLSNKTGPRRAFSGRRWSRWVMMSVFWSLKALLTTFFDMMIFYGDASPRQTKHYRVKPTWFLAQW